MLWLCYTNTRTFHKGLEHLWNLGVYWGQSLVHTGGMVVGPRLFPIPTYI